MGRDPVYERDETALVRDLRAGDEEAYAFVFRVHGPRLLCVARRVLGTDSDAEDALQDALVSAFRGIDRFDEAARLSTWLHRITINAALMIRRRDRRRREWIDLGTHSEVEDPGESAADALVRREVCHDVRRHVRQMAPRLRRIVTLRDLHDVGTREAARRLGMSSNAARTLLHRARRALRASMEDSSFTAVRRTA